MEVARSAEVEKQKSLEHRVDTAHIWVTTQAPPEDKPYSTLGELSYTEPFSPDAIDEAKMSDKLKKMAFEGPDRDLSVWGRTVAIRVVGHECLPAMTLSGYETALVDEDVTDGFSSVIYSLGPDSDDDG